ncbi:MAG: adenosylmethionine decarboxylase [Flavobacteriales bacterium]|nr:adenosylmethionine decarboxylase [Flavobacteriales bacterium]
MNELGIHILMEFNECPFDVLDNLEELEQSLNEAARAADATIIKSIFHQFSPQGVTGVVVVAESHLAIHTWPEYNYAAVDFFTCNLSMDYMKTYNLLVQHLKSTKHSYQTIKRGTSTKQIMHELPKS